MQEPPQRREKRLIIGGLFALTVVAWIFSLYSWCGERSNTSFGIASNSSGDWGDVNLLQYTGGRRHSMLLNSDLLDQLAVKTDAKMIFLVMDGLGGMEVPEKG